MSCATTHYAGCVCHEAQWEARLNQEREELVSLRTRLAQAEAERGWWKNNSLEHQKQYLASKRRTEELEAAVEWAITVLNGGSERGGVFWREDAVAILTGLCIPGRKEREAMERTLKAARVMRMYCLGSDCSTLNMLEEYDAAAAALDALRSGKGEA